MTVEDGVKPINSQVQGFQTSLYVTLQIIWIVFHWYFQQRQCVVPYWMYSRREYSTSCNTRSTYLLKPIDGMTYRVVLAHSDRVFNFCCTRYIFLRERWSLTFQRWQSSQYWKSFNILWMKKLDLFWFPQKGLKHDSRQCLKNIISHQHKVEEKADEKDVMTMKNEPKRSSQLRSNVLHRRYISTCWQLCYFEMSFSNSANVNIQQYSSEVHWSIPWIF